VGVDGDTLEGEGEIPALTWRAEAEACAGDAEDDAGGGLVPALMAAA
jgi:hypothetical protein